MEKETAISGDTPLFTKKSVIMPSLIPIPPGKNTDTSPIQILKGKANA